MRRRQWHPTSVRLPGKSHGWRSLVGCSPWGRWESDRTEWLHFHFSLPRIGEGNGNPLQCSCLENPRDGGAWWAVVYGVTQSQTRPKQLRSSSSSELWNQYNGSWQAILKNEIENMSEFIAHKSKYCSMKPSVSVVCVYWVAMSNVFLIMNPQAKKPLKNYCSRPCMLLGYFKIYFSNPFFE